MWLLSAEHGARPRAQANSSSLLIGCGFRDRSDRSAATADLDRQRKEAGRQLDGRTPGRPTGSPSGTHDDPGSTVGGTPFEPQREDGRGSATRSGVPGRHAPAAPRSAQRRAMRSSRSNRPRCPRSIGQAEVAATGSGTGPAQPAAATARWRTSAPVIGAGGGHPVRHDTTQGIGAVGCLGAAGQAAGRLPPRGPPPPAPRPTPWPATPSIGRATWGRGPAPYIRPI